MELNSCWRGTKEAKINDYEDEVLRISELPESEFKSYNVPIYFTTHDYLDEPRKDDDDEMYIWTYEIGRPNECKPTIVMIHGYGGSGMIFYRAYTELAKRYHVIFMDLLGMGRSARPSFYARTAEESENFFVNSLEKWRQTMELEKMILIGHSFGGFVSGRYTAKYPQNVAKAVFLSSLGKLPRKHKSSKYITFLNLFSS